MSSDHHHPQGEGCLARSVADTLAEEPTLEAVTFDATQKKISVATLGRADVERLTERLTGKIQAAQSADAGRACSLLSGQGDCGACDSPLSEAELKRITIQRHGDATTIARVTCPTAPKFWRWRDLPFPRIEPRTVEIPDEDDHDHHHADEWKLQLAAAMVCGACGLLAALVVPAQYKVFAFVAAYLAGGFYPAEEVWERLQKRVLDVHFLMLAVAVGAACIGAWAEGATLLFLFSFSGALEHYALGRTQKEIRSLFRDAPKTATAIDARGNETEVPVGGLRAGRRLLIKPGSQFPVDVEIVKGTTAADESNLTGEAAPVEKAVGDSAFAGTLNLWGAVEVIVTKPAAESSLQKIITLIKEAQHQKAPSQRFADKFSTYYTYGALGLSLAMFFVWWLGFGLTAFTSTPEVRSAFYRTMTLLVVSSPCALVLSIPSAVLAAIAWSARHGILFRGGAAVEKLAAVDVVCLDKTGTLTTGELRVEKIESFPAGRENEIARLAYSLEKLSTHPLARAITLHGKRQGLTAIEFPKFESVTGQGLRAKHDGADIFLGKRGWVLERRTPIRQVVRAESEFGVPTDVGTSEVWVSAGDLLGRIILRDDIRPQAASVLEDLRHEGLKSVVLTGDNRAAAEHLRTELKLDDVRAGLKPEEKVAAIRELSGQGRRVAMIGDGVNDAPSLAVAHIGVAMGARGSDAALEQADVVLMHDRLENFLAAFRLSQRASRIIKQNLFISLGTVVVLVTFAMLGKIPLTIGVVGHEGSTVVVVMNSLRLLFGGSDKKAPSTKLQHPEKHHALTSN
ncbi:MAG TPA: cation-translocating P-type ATPase [Candidatus Acidoferrales bacterium]|jgi:Cd2+/Zn2+-exporting ATPase|nr:cation-translocating P-type ATPase [Candidatus Acidoferrales bacterium]